MKKYIVPELEIKNFEVEDIIMTSSNPSGSSVDPLYNNTTTADVVDDISYSTLFGL